MQIVSFGHLNTCLLVSFLAVLDHFCQSSKKILSQVFSEGCSGVLGRRVRLTQKVSGRKEFLGHHIQCRCFSWRKLVFLSEIKAKWQNTSLSSFNVRTNAREKTGNGPCLQNFNSSANQVREKRFSQS